LLGLICFAAGSISVFSGALCAAQSPAATPDNDIAGACKGLCTFPAAANHPAIDLRIVNRITKGDDGKLMVSDYSIDQGAGEMKSLFGQL